MTAMDADTLSGEVIGGAIEVHRQLGPGLLESSYQAALAHELTLRGMQIVREKRLPVRYKGIDLDDSYRIDLLVNGTLIVEVKALDHVLAVHQAQVLSYLKHSGISLGLLINFNVPVLKQRIRRFVNGTRA